MGQTSYRVKCIVRRHLRNAPFSSAFFPGLAVQWFCTQFQTGANLTEIPFSSSIRFLTFNAEDRGRNASNVRSVDGFFPKFVHVFR